MRMRKKKNLESRLENVSDYIIDIGDVYGSYNDTPPQTELLSYRELFGNDNPVRLEIGCGKGQFAMEIATRYPEINFIAVEISRNVVVQACEKAQKAGLKNLLFLIVGAEKLEALIPAGTVELIYLNFSCPFPKKRQAKHRLTHESFLEIYKNLLVESGEIHQKTDNMLLFEFSVEQFSKCGFVLSEVSLDLHNSGFEGNIVTEYEKRFTDLGQPIYRLVATKR